MSKQVDIIRVWHEENVDTLLWLQPGYGIHNVLLGCGIPNNLITIYKGSVVPIHPKFSVNLPIAYSQLLGENIDLRTVKTREFLNSMETSGRTVYDLYMDDKHLRKNMRFYSISKICIEAYGKQTFDSQVVKDFTLLTLSNTVSSNIEYLKETLAKSIGLMLDKEDIEEITYSSVYLN